MTSLEFTFAQQRIAARRAAREVRPGEGHSVPKKRDLRFSAQLSRLPGPLRQLGGAVFSTWENISGREGTQPSFRVGQVDAELLDEELLELLKAQVGDGLKYFDAHLQDEWAAEIMLVLRIVLFKLTMWDHDATYGAALQNLRYSDARHNGEELLAPSKWQKISYGLVTTGGRYVWTCWAEWLVRRTGGYDVPSESVKKLSKLQDFMTNIHSAAALINFLVFLVNGRYRTLLDRLMRLRLAPPTNQVSRQVSFEYLNRQLVWHAFTEFLLFFLPLVGISRWRRLLTRLWRKTKSILLNGVEKEGDVKSGKFASLPERTCAICYQDQNPNLSSEAEAMANYGSSGIIGSAQTDITNPYENIPCQCIYCFVCIASRLEAEEGDAWTCLRCGQDVKECRPWNGDVITEVPKQPMLSSKSVIFSESDPKNGADCGVD